VWPVAGFSGFPRGIAGANKAAMRIPCTPLLIGSLFVSTTAAAQSPEAQRSAPSAPAEPSDGFADDLPFDLDGEDDDPDATRQPTIVPAADTRSSHFTAALALNVALPFGSLDQRTAQRDVMATGFGGSLDLGFGLSRSVVVGAWAQWLSFGSPDECSACSATSFALGPFVRYHLVQGTRFDPWLAAGVGYRRLTVDLGPADTSYSGIEWLRLQVGGDWYATKTIGLGPVLELDLGSFYDRPDTAGGAAANWRFIAAARVTLDLPGK
jgi:hypothetical protein